MGCSCICAAAAPSSALNKYITRPLSCGLKMLLILFMNGCVCVLVYVNTCILAMCRIKLNFAFFHGEKKTGKMFDLNGFC